MATNPSTLAENVGRITPPDANYPYASAKDDSTGTTGDGTPIKSPLLNDSYGFFQAALVAAGIVPSGNAETALESQILQALQGAVGSFSDKSQWPTVANGADADHDINFRVGKITDSTGLRPIISAPITKRLDAAWAVGIASGGLFSGTISADTTYHCFLIVRDSDGLVDAGFDVDPAAANIPTGYTTFRRIASIYTDASANIVQFFQRGDRFTLKTRVNSFTATNGILAGSDTVIDVAVPSGLPNVMAHLSVLAYVTGVGEGISPIIIIQSLEETSEDPSVSSNTPWSQNFVNHRTGGMVDILSGTTAQAKMRGQGVTVGYTLPIYVNTFGWTDDRG
jgi:hypothetical protein